MGSLLLGYPMGTLVPTAALVTTATWATFAMLWCHLASNVYQEKQLVAVLFL